MAVQTLTSDSLTVPYMPMTNPALQCPPPILTQNFENCLIPGGITLWESHGFYSPGQCFVGYRAMCTQTSARWPIQEGETVVRCIPTCVDEDRDQRFATTVYDGTVLSAPAFEIRWRREDITAEPVAFDTSTTSRETVIEASGGTSSAETLSTPTLMGTETETSRLDAGTVAGIVVGAILGILGIALAILFISLRRRQKRRVEELQVLQSFWDRSTIETTPVEARDQDTAPKELAADGNPISPLSQRTFELGREVACIEVNSVPVELDGQEVVTLKGDERSEVLTGRKIRNGSL